MNFSEHHGEPFKRFSGLCAVAMLHIGVVFALLHLSNHINDIAHEPLIAKIIEETKPPPEPPPPPKPREPLPYSPPKVTLPYVPPPEVALPTPQAPSPITTTQVKPPDNSLPPIAIAPASVTPEPAKPAAPAIVPAVINFDTPGCRPEWPRSSLLNEETGTVKLAVLIGADGSVTDVKIEKSSGFKELDNAVKTQLLSGACRNKPGTVDGKPQSLWIRVLYVWRLTS
jgi:protein TonB